MPLRLPAVSLLLVTLGAFAGSAPGRAPVAPNLLSGLVWRNLGPFRGGRISAVSGAIGQPGVFYIGLPLGGVWKTTSVGETWSPIFDDVTAASSVGALEVAPSDANVIYVGMGDLIAGGGINEGNGVYKSVDAGKTWQHLGLDGTRQIPSILVDPRDPNLVLIAAQGDVHKKSETRGAFRSTDGGKTWTKTLYVDDSTGLQKLAWASDHPEIMLATSVRRHLAPDGRRRQAHRQRSGRLQLRRLRRSQEPRRRLHRQHGDVQVHRRRHQLHRLQGRPRRRRSAAAVDRPHQRPAHAPRARS